MKLNLGCGQLKFRGFENVDYPEVDLRKPLPYADESVDEILMIHVLEHLGKDEAIRCLTECKRIMRAGGRLMVEVPDIYRCFRVARSTDELASYVYGDPANSRNGNILEYHRWAWCQRTLTDCMLKVGFPRVDSKDGKFHGRPDRDILMEARK